MAAAVAGAPLKHNISAPAWVSAPAHSSSLRPCPLLSSHTLAFRAPDSPHRHEPKLPCACHVCAPALAALRDIVAIRDSTQPNARHPAAPATQRLPSLLSPGMALHCVQNLLYHSAAELVPHSSGPGLKSLAETDCTAPRHSDVMPPLPFCPAPATPLLRTASHPTPQCVSSDSSP